MILDQIIYLSPFIAKNMLFKIINKTQSFLSKKREINKIYKG